MSPDQIRAALKTTEGQIIGLKSSARRDTGKVYRGARSEWPASTMAALDALKNRAKEYHRMLAEAEGKTS